MKTEELQSIINKVYTNIRGDIRQEYRKKLTPKQIRLLVDYVLTNDSIKVYICSTIMNREKERLPINDHYIEHLASFLWSEAKRLYINDNVIKNIILVSSYSVYDLDPVLQENTDDEATYCNENICNNCSNCCCTIYPCELIPEDIKEEYLSEEGIRKLLDTNMIVIDCFTYKIVNLYYLRIKSLNDCDRKFNPSNGGICLALLPGGCGLDFCKRPKLGRRTIPNEKGYGFCSDPDISDSSQTYAALAWKDEKYQSIFRKIICELLLENDKEG